MPVFSRGAFRFVLNAARALHLTAFHGLYLHTTPGGAAVDALMRFMGSAAGQRSILAQTRIYGGGLRKLEPRDVAAIEIPRRLAEALTPSGGRRTGA